MKNDWDTLINHQEHPLDIGGIMITVHDGVFTPDPNISQTASIIIENLPDLRGKKVADIGTGTGIIALHAVAKGATSVVATEVDSKAMKNATQNISANKSSDVILLIKTDLLDGVDGQFDYIFANVPILDEIWEHMETGDSSLLERLVVTAKEKLTETGELFIPWGSFSEEKRLPLEQLLTKHNFSFTVQSKELLGYTWYLYRVKKEYFI